MIVELFLKRVEKGMTEEQIIKSSPLPNFTKWFRKGPDILIRVLAAILFVLYILFGQAFLGGAFFSFVVLWFLFFEWLLKRPKVLYRGSVALWAIVLALPPILVLIAGLGYSAGNSPLQSNREDRYTLCLKNVSDPIQAKVVRFLEKGILFKSAPQLPTVFVKWDEVARIEKPPVKPWRGMVGDWFDFPKETPTPAKGKP